MDGFLRYQFRGLIFGGSYTWRGLFLGILRYFSCHFHHRLYYELTITRSPVCLIRSTDRGLPVVSMQSRFDTSCFKASLLSQVVNKLYT